MYVPCSPSWALSPSELWPRQEQVADVNEHKDFVDHAVWSDCQARTQKRSKFTKKNDYPKKCLSMP